MKLLKKFSEKFHFGKVAGFKNEFIQGQFSRFLVNVYVNLFMTFGKTASVNQNHYQLQIDSFI